MRCLFYTRTVFPFLVRARQPKLNTIMMDILWVQMQNFIWNYNGKVELMPGRNHHTPYRTKRGNGEVCNCFNSESGCTFPTKCLQDLWQSPCGCKAFSGSLLSIVWFMFSSSNIQIRMVQTESTYPRYRLQKTVTGMKAHSPDLLRVSYWIRAFINHNSRDRMSNTNQRFLVYSTKKWRCLETLGEE